MSSERSRRFLSRIPLWLPVWVGAFLVQFFVLNMIADSRHFLPDGDDMKFYNDWALKLLGQIEWKPGEPNAPGTAYYGLPGYAYALAGIYKMTGGYDHSFSPYVVGQLQAVLHAFTATWLFLLGRRIFGGSSREENRRGIAIGIAAAAAWALFTPAQVFSSILMPTAWVVCAFWGLTLWLVCIHEKGPASWWRPWLWIGLVAGFVAMLVATILMLLPLVVVAIALTVARGKALQSRILPVLGAVAILMGGVYAGCSPVWIHNYFIAKDQVLLSAHDGLNFYLGNHADSNGYTSIPKGLRASQEGLLTDSLTIPEKVLGHPLKRSEASAFWKKKGSAFIREHTVAWMRLLWRKFENFWNAFQYDDLSILKLLRDEHATPPGLRFGFAAALGLPGLIFCWRRWPRSRWVAGSVLLHMAALLPVFITERYRLAAVPGLLLLGTGGLWLLWENVSVLLLKNTRLPDPREGSREVSAIPDRPLEAGRSSSSRLPALIAQLLLTLACAWFVSVPQADIGLWSLDFYKAGIRATDGADAAMAHAKHAGDEQQSARLLAASRAYLASAQRNLETAFAYVPNNAEITFALGNVWFHRHDLARAKTCYGRALQLSAPVIWPPFPIVIWPLIYVVQIPVETGRPHDGALRNLGIIALEEKQWGAAEKFFTGALKAEPDSAKTYFLIARARREAGNIPGALAAIEVAIRLDGRTPDFQKFHDELRGASPSPK